MKSRLPVQASVEQLFIDQSPQKTPVWTASPKSLRQHWARCFSDFRALGAPLNPPPGPAEPLGHVVGRTGVVGGIALPAEAHGHVGVQVDRRGGGRVQLDDVWEADFVGSGGREYAEALEVHTPADFTRCLETEIC